MEQWLTPQAMVAITALITAMFGAITEFLRKRAEPAKPTHDETIESFSKLTKEQRKELIFRDNTINIERHKVSLWEKWYIMLKLGWDDLRQKSEPPDRPEYEA